VRPGDSLVLAGLVTSADTNTRQGLPTGDDSSIPLYGDDQYNNHELVIIVKPSIVLFSDKKEVEEAAKKDTARPLPDAVVIDKDGSHNLALPATPVTPAKPVAATASSEPVGYRAELMTSDPMAAPTENMPLSPGDDSAPVDKLLMQRGFSHAFDQLLQKDGGS